MKFLFASCEAAFKASSVVEEESIAGAMEERSPMMGIRRPRGRTTASVLRVGAAAVVAVCLLAAASGAGGRVVLLGGTQMLVVGEAYPYVRTPYSDVYRPYGYQAPAEYPLYPYESGYTYKNVEPYYQQYHKDDSKTYHEWFPDDYNVGTGPLTPLWTAMGMKQMQAQQAALRQRMEPSPLQALGTPEKTEETPKKNNGRTKKNNNKKYGLGMGHYAPTQAVDGGQYYSPILPTENEFTPWSIFGDNWADHTYEPSVNPGANREARGHAGSKLLESKLRAAAKSEARLGDDRGFQQLAHADWHSRGHSNNYMGMRAPVRNVNPLGDHQLGWSDVEYNVTDSPEAVEKQNLVVDKTLRSMWDVFAGNEDVTQFQVC